MKTDVEFRYNKSKNDLFAIFPEVNEGHNVYAIYSHKGQHSSAHMDYIKESELAAPSQYMELKSELESLGYDLRILNFYGMGSLKNN